jgi:hypothetical protein
LPANIILGWKGLPTKKHMIIWPIHKLLVSLKVAGVKVYQRQNQNIATHAVTACKYYVTSWGNNSIDIAVGKL